MELITAGNSEVSPNRSVDFCNECCLLIAQLEQARQSHRNDIKSFAQERSSLRARIMNLEQQLRAPKPDTEISPERKNAIMTQRKTSANSNSSSLERQQP